MKKVILLLVMMGSFASLYAQGLSRKQALLQEIELVIPLWASSPKKNFQIH